MKRQHYNLAFIFPGQGSQSIGMLAALAESFHSVRETFSEASDILGRDIWLLISEGPVEELNQTENTQPAMLAAGVATWKVWCSKTDVRPSWMAGHSLGEYTALVCCGAMRFADAVQLVAERGRLMQEAVPPGDGAMAAVLGLEDHQVVKLCADAAGDEGVAAVNFNSPGQVVIAGDRAPVERAIEAAKEAGARRALMLPVSVPSHCALMRPAAEKLAAMLKRISVKLPEIPLIHNVDVASHGGADAIGKNL